MTRHERRLMWQERVDQYRASGMSVAAWCRENEVSEQQMYYWLRKFRSEEADAVEGDIQWIQLGGWDRQAALRAIEDSAVRIHIGSAIVEVRPGFDPVLLRGVVKCIFQPKSTTYSDASRPPGPIHLDHPFRSKPTTDPSLKSTTFSSLPEWVVAMDRNQWSRSSESMVAMTGTADLKRR